MSDGKKAVWEITDPLRSDGLFRDMNKDINLIAAGMSRTHPDAGDPDTANLPPGFTEYLGLDPDDSSTPRNSPYHVAATILACCMPFQCNRGNIVRFLSFISHLDPRYKALLEQRDRRALLLLAYWFAKVFSYSQWWIWRRATMEGPAICLYLERTHADDPKLLELLAFPKSVFGC
jgi:hypothetical protein